MTQKADEFGAHILPIDSEHNAVFNVGAAGKAIRLEIEKMVK